MLAVVMLFTASVTCDAQAFRLSQRMHLKNIYTNVDSIVLEAIPTVAPTDDGDYLIQLPHKSKLVIAYNADKTKAIVLRSGFVYMRHYEYNVKDEGVRLILWHKDEHVYCGYIYDKKSKAGNYFEAMNQDEKDKLTKRLPFLRRIPTFTND